MYLVRATVLAILWALCLAPVAQAQDDLAAAREKLAKAFAKYDKQISAMLERSQDLAFNADNEDLHGVYFGAHDLTRANVNGYQAFLQQKLRLDPKQQDHLYWVERRMYSECEPLWRKVRDLAGGSH